jgi:hypothetical protein
MIMDIKYRRPGIAGSLCNKLFEKELLETVFWAIDDTCTYSEDGLCTYAALLECKKICIIHTPFYHYRQHTASAVYQYTGTKRYEKALYAYYAYEGMLRNRGFDLTEQINAYIAVNSVDIIRNMLLFDRQNCLSARINQARQFASDQIVQTALASGRQRFSENRSRWKMLLVQKRYITVLYILLRVRYCMLKNTE